MASEISKCRIISREESIKLYDLPEPGKKIILIGQELTDEKVKKAVTAYSIFNRTSKSNRQEVRINHNKLIQVCKAEKLELIIRD